MREIAVQNRTSQDWLKRDCMVTEHMQQGEYTTTVVKRCTYRIESQTALPSLNDCVPWAQSLDPLPPRQVYVRKNADDMAEGEHVVYKILGHFYVVLGTIIFCVGYRHVLSMRIVPMQPEA